MNFKTLLELIRETRFKNSNSNVKQYKIIENSQLFDKDFYSREYDCGGMDSILHYMLYGYKTNNIPSNSFDTLKYYEKYMKYSHIRINPIVHYINEGKDNGYEIEPVDKEKVFDEIVEKNKKNLTNYKFDEEPLVSIIILNRNGLNYLKNLFKDFKDNTNYDNYEIIIVDNDSSDGSIEYIKSLDLPISIIETHSNKSFSECNNIGFKSSKGELILLMNNDMETTYGWLNELVGNILADDRIGAVGCKLIYPYFLDNNREISYSIQSAGDSFRRGNNGYTPYNLNKTDYLWDDDVVNPKHIVAITAAALLTRRDIYEEVNGLDEDYFYCYEDVDFCLKLNQAGYYIKYCPNALIVHYESPTRKKDINLRDNIALNRKIFNKKWYNYLNRHILEDKLYDNNLFTYDDLNVVFVEDSQDSNISCNIKDLFDDDSCDVSVLNLDDEEEYNFSINDNLVISLTPYYDPLEISPSLDVVKIAWILTDEKKWGSQLDLYNINIFSDKNLYEKYDTFEDTYYIDLSVDRNEIQNNLKEIILNFYDGKDDMKLPWEN